jgi:hypothetical protein
MMADLYIYLLAVIFLHDLWQDPVSYHRSVILLGFNFLEVILAFAVIYMSTGAVAGQDGPITSATDAV